MVVCRPPDVEMCVLLRCLDQCRKYAILRNVRTYHNYHLLSNITANCTKKKKCSPCVNGQSLCDKLWPYCVVVEQELHALLPNLFKAGHLKRDIGLGVTMIIVKL